MGLIPKESERKKPWVFRPLHLLIIWGLLALLLIINGTYEAKRAKDNLYRLLFDQGAAFIGGLEANARSLLANLAAAEAFPEASPFLGAPISLLTLEESVIDLFLERALQIDRELGQGLIPQKKIQEIGSREHLSGILLVRQKPSAANYERKNSAKEGGLPFYQPLLEGKAPYAIQRSEKSTTGQMDHLAIAVVRKEGEGVLVLTADEPSLHFFRQRVILQGLIEEWRGKGDTQYITFQEKDAEILAGTDTQKIGQKESSALIQELLQNPGGGPLARVQDHAGVFEVIKVVKLDRNNPIVLRVGISTQKVEQILKIDQRNTVFFSLILLVSGAGGIAFIYRMESRHMARVREMEEKIHQAERLSSLANLSAGVAHEIRNPLNAIGMVIQRLQREFAPEGKDQQAEYYRFTDVLRGEVNRINGIIEQFLFFARPARLDLQWVQVEDVLKNILLLSREAAVTQKILIEEEIGPGLPLLKADQHRLQEALWNLVNNSLQAMPQGGRLGFSARREGEKEVLIQIADTGEGIAEENLGRIFDYYFTTKEKGIGLGLPLAHKIIQDHGGSIEVRSTLGQGTTFRVHLPVPRVAG
jgi:signal transduction histidine kinase